jgi:hypothetical protein
LGHRTTGSEYLMSQAILQQISRKVAEFFERYDIWLTPTLAEPPLPLGWFDAIPDNPLRGFDRAVDYVPFTPLPMQQANPPCRFHCSGTRKDCRWGCTSSAALVMRGRCSGLQGSLRRHALGRTGGPLFRVETALQRFSITWDHLRAGRGGMAGPGCYSGQPLG